MSEKRFRKVMGFIQDNICERGDMEGVMDLAEIEDMLNELYEENEKLKCINNQTDEELIDVEMTNIECLMLLIPFGILFVLLTGIIIAFLVQLGWVVL